MMDRIRREIGREDAPARRPGSGGRKDDGATWEWGRPVFFRVGSPWLRLLISGWSDAETDHVWSDGRSAITEIPPPPARREILAVYSLVPFLPSGVNEQTVRLMVGNRLVSLWSITEPGNYTVLVPRPAAERVPVRLTWHFPDARSPHELDINADTRALSVAIESLTVYCLNPDERP